MKVSHAAAAVDVAFDDPNLAMILVVSDCLVLAMSGDESFVARLIREAKPAWH